MTKINIKKSKPIGIGDWFTNDKKLFLIVQVTPGEICAICVSKESDNGNRYQDPIKVKNVNNITKDELAETTEGINKYRKINVEINEI